MGDDAAEAQVHHSDIGFGWGWSRVAWQTRKIKRLPENDLIMTAITDRLTPAT